MSASTIFKPITPSPSPTIRSRSISPGSRSISPGNRSVTIYNRSALQAINPQTIKKIPVNKKKIRKQRKYLEAQSSHYLTSVATSIPSGIMGFLKSLYKKSANSDNIIGAAAISGGIISLLTLPIVARYFIKRPSNDAYNATIKTCLGLTTLGLSGAGPSLIYAGIKGVGEESAKLALSVGTGFAAGVTCVGVLSSIVELSHAISQTRKFQKKIDNLDKFKDNYLDQEFHLSSEREKRKISKEGASAEAKVKIDEICRLIKLRHEVIKGSNKTKSRKRKTALSKIVGLFELKLKRFEKNQKKTKSVETQVQIKKELSEKYHNYKIQAIQKINELSQLEGNSNKILKWTNKLKTALSSERNDRGFVEKSRRRIIDQLKFNKAIAQDKRGAYILRGLGNICVGLSFLFPPAAIGLVPVGAILIGLGAWRRSRIAKIEKTHKKEIEKAHKQIGNLETIGRDFKNATTPIITRRIKQIPHDKNLNPKLNPTIVKPKSNNTKDKEVPRTTYLGANSSVNYQRKAGANTPIRENTIMVKPKQNSSPTQTSQIIEEYLEYDAQNTTQFAQKIYNLIQGLPKSSQEKYHKEFKELFDYKKTEEKNKLQSAKPKPINKKFKTKVDYLIQKLNQEYLSSLGVVGAYKEEGGELKPFYGHKNPEGLSDQLADFFERKDDSPELNDPNIIQMTSILLDGGVGKLGKYLDKFGYIKPGNLSKLKKEIQKNC